MRPKHLRSLTDAQLAETVRAGQRGAFDELYRRWSTKLYHYFWKMLWQDAERATDAVQDCFMRVVENLERYDSTYAFSTWIYTIAYNMCKNTYRKQQNDRKAMEDLTQEASQRWQQPEAVEMGRSLDQAVYSSHLKSALQTLTEEQQCLLTLRFEEELEIKAIAEILDIPEGTVKSRLHYILKKLALQLAPLQQI
ncbi:MAG: sigma-70 family RNA polymerase sigma factor [Bacteroidetes bacterium]|nr:sigma-70 family RNA polymerase sigma factor [Bacteroidota bacterium]